MLFFKRKISIHIHTVHVYVYTHRMLEEEFDMELVRKQNFYHFFQEHRDYPDDRSLLFRMSAFDRRLVRSYNSTGILSCWCQKKSSTVVCLFLLLFFILLLS